jgi:hypothetical protein
MEFVNLSPKAKVLANSPPLTVEDLHVSLDQIFRDCEVESQRPRLKAPIEPLKIEARKATFSPHLVANSQTVSGACGKSLQLELAKHRNQSGKINAKQSHTWSGSNPKGINVEKGVALEEGMHHVRNEMRRRTSRFAHKAHLKDTKLRNETGSKYESFDYDFHDTPHLQQKSASLTGNVLLANKHTEIVRWLLAVVVGIVVATITFAMTLILTQCVNWKFKVIADYVEKDNYTAAYFFNLAVTAVCVLIASGLTAIAPASAGSGK